MACVVRDSGPWILRVLDWRETFPSRSSRVSTRLPAVVLVEWKRMVDGVRNFRMEPGMPPTHPPTPSLYLFLYNSLDEGEWS